MIHLRSFSFSVMTIEPALDRYFKFQHFFFAPNQMLKSPLKPQFLSFPQTRSATKKSGGSSSNGRTSNPKYLGFKKNDSDLVNAGDIILRQRGTRWHPGTDVGNPSIISIQGDDLGKRVSHDLNHIIIAFTINNYCFYYHLK